MDAVSNAIGFAAAAIQVIRFVKTTIEDIKDAPARLRSLSSQADDIEYLLKKLQHGQEQSSIYVEDDLRVSNRWIAHAT